jgi:hypothetical protein
MLSASNVLLDKGIRVIAIRVIVIRVIVIRVIAIRVIAIKVNIRKKKTCQRPANGANDVLTVPFLHVQKFGTKFSIVSAN